MRGRGRLRRPAVSEAMLWNAMVPGFELRVRLGGRQMWIVRRRKGGGVLRRTLGTVEVFLADAARGAARTLISAASAGAVSPAMAPRVQACDPVFLARFRHQRRG